MTRVYRLMSLLLITVITLLSPLFLSSVRPQVQRPSGIRDLYPVKDTSHVNESMNEIVVERPALFLGPESHFNGVSDCMEGDILLRAIFVDSNGSIDPNIHSWNTGEIDSIVANITREMEWTWSLWSSRYSKRIKVWVEKFVVPIAYEPVLRSGGAESHQIWTNPALSTVLNRQYVGTTWVDAFNAAAEFGRNGRNGNNSFSRSFDHATVLFIAPNLNRSRAQDGFSDGSTAFAYIGGPYGIMLRNNFSIGPLERVAAHEFGHLFYAEDEYSGATRCNGSTNCNAVTEQTDRTSCRNNQSINGNCEACNPAGAGCVMKYNSTLLCTYTPRQVGWLTPKLSEPVITKVKCPGCMDGGKIVVKGTGIGPGTTVYINRTPYPTTYRPDTADLIVKNLRLPDGNYEFHVKRSTDSLFSDSFFKLIYSTMPPEPEF